MVDLRSARVLRVGVRRDNEAPGKACDRSGAIFKFLGCRDLIAEVLVRDNRK